MIDAGTVINMRVVHSTLSNPYSGMAPLPKKGNDWRGNDYQLEIKTAISEINSYNSMNFDGERIFIVPICHDRLPAQATAVSKVIKMLKEQNDRIPIVDVSCLNHLIHNSFLGAINRCIEFQSLIKDITFIVSIAIDFVGKKIPNPPQNRWIYLCDVLHFIIYNIEKINAYLIQYWLQTHEPLDIKKDLIEHFYILTPLQKASLCFECEQARLADVFPVLQTLFKSYKLILDNSRIEMESSLEILKELLCQLLARVETYLPNESWAVWASSREERFILRSQNVDSGIVQGNVCGYTDEKFSMNDAANNMERDIEK